MIDPGPKRRLMKMFSDRGEEPNEPKYNTKWMGEKMLTDIFEKDIIEAPHSGEWDHELLACAWSDLEDRGLVTSTLIANYTRWRLGVDR